MVSETSIITSKEEAKAWEDYSLYDKDQLEILIDSTKGFTFKMKKMILNYVFHSKIVFTLEEKAGKIVQKTQLKVK